MCSSVAIQTAGAWNAMSVELVEEISRRIKNMLNYHQLSRALFDFAQIL